MKVFALFAALLLVLGSDAFTAPVSPTKAKPASSTELEYGRHMTGGVGGSSLMPYRASPAHMNYDNYGYNYPTPYRGGYNNYNNDYYGMNRYVYGGRGYNNNYNYGYNNYGRYNSGGYGYNYGGLNNYYGNNNYYGGYGGRSSYNYPYSRHIYSGNSNYGGGYGGYGGYRNPYVNARYGNGYDRSPINHYGGYRNSRYMSYY